jgi:hypothetical protein
MSLVPPWRSRYRDPAAICFLLGSFPGATLSLIQITSYGYDARLTGWVALALVPVVGAILLFALGAQIRLTPSTALTAVLTTLLGAALPLIGSVFRPVSEPATVDLDLGMSVVGYREDAKLGRVAMVNSQLTTKNISKRRLVAVASVYTVRSISSKIRDDQSGSYLRERLTLEFDAQGWTGRYENPWQPELVEGGYANFLAGDFLEPGQHDVTNFLTPVPLSAGNTAEVHVSVGTAFADRLRLGTQVDAHSSASLVPGERMVSRTWQVNPTGWLNRLTMGEQELRVEYGVDSDDQGPKFYFQIQAGLYRQRPSPADNKYNEKVANVYGLGWTTCYSSVPLDLKDQTK